MDTVAYIRFPARSCVGFPTCQESGTQRPNRSRVRPPEEAADHRDLPELLGPGLRKLSELPRDLPPKILTLLKKLNDWSRTRSCSRIKMPGLRAV